MIDSRLKRSRRSDCHDLHPGGDYSRHATFLAGDQFEIFIDILPSASGTSGEPRLRENLVLGCRFPDSQNLFLFQDGSLFFSSVLVCILYLVSLSISFSTPQAFRPGEVSVSTAVVRRDRNHPSPGSKIALPTNHLAILEHPSAALMLMHRSWHPSTLSIVEPWAPTAVKLFQSA